MSGLNPIHYTLTFYFKIFLSVFVALVLRYLSLVGSCEFLVCKYVVKRTKKMQYNSDKEKLNIFADY